MPLSTIVKESLWREYCLLCLRDGRTPDRSDFEVQINSDSTYEENLSLIRGRLTVPKRPSKVPESPFRPRHLGVVALLLLSVPAVFLYGTTPEAVVGPVSAMQAFRTATNSVSEYGDARLISVINGNGSRAIVESLSNPRQYADGRALYWSWVFYSPKSGKMIQVTTFGRAVDSIEVVPRSEAPSSSIIPERWRIDSAEVVNTATLTLENSWRSDGVVSVQFELVWSQERNTVLWFVTFLPSSRVLRSRVFIVVIDGSTGRVLYSMER